MAVTAQFTDKPVSVNFEIGHRGKLQEIADRDGVSVNAVVRFLVGTDNSIDDVYRGRVRVTRG